MDSNECISTVVLIEASTDIQLTSAGRVVVLSIANYLSHLQIPASNHMIG